VVANVINNAAKYTAEGGHLVLCTLVRESDVLIEVTDDGIGMTPEMTKHAFDLFTQAERTSDRASGGLGLGLSLVKSLVELHGGSVGCKSGGLGEGSTFSISLPLLREKTNPASSDASFDDSHPTNAASLRILIVDDNVDAADMLRLVLEASGHEVAVEHGPYPALEKAKRDSPQICLIDIGLPDIDGNELARRLRAQPGNRHAVLVAVTGYGQDSDRLDALAAGFDHLLVKPVDTAKLFAILAEAGSSERPQFSTVSISSAVP
jgi:CheY-like chemotaxis protein